MQRKFSITGTDDLEGDYPLIFTIFDDNGAQVATASTTLKIVEDLPEEKKSFSLLTIGDSLSCNTATYERLNELTDNKIIYMGTRGVGGSLTEARRGFSAANYLTDAPYTMEEPHVRYSLSTMRRLVVLTGNIIRKRQDFTQMQWNCSWEPTDWRKIRQKMVIILLPL